mgnify:CR=1 FL=1
MAAVVAQAVLEQSIFTQKLHITLRRSDKHVVHPHRGTALRTASWIIRVVIEELQIAYERFELGQIVGEAA